MKKRLLFICIANLVFGISYGQFKGLLDVSKIPPTTLHYQQEYTFDSTLNPAAWAAQKKGLHVSFATTDELYFRSEVPELAKESKLWTETGWKGERLNTQI